MKTLSKNKKIPVVILLLVIVSGLGGYYFLFYSAATNPNAVVPAAPMGPTTPSGGWSVEYADAFGSCLTDTNTKCSSGYARSDNTLGAVTKANGAGNPNEIDAAMPSADDITAQGLDIHCSATPNLGDSYTCGIVSDGANGSVAPGGFHWIPASNVNLVIQAEFKAPANQGNMDPSFWINGPSDVPEVDIPEMWGMNHFPPAGATNTWCGFQFGDPAVPFDTGPTGNVQATFCQSPGANIDPSSGFHTWTFWENGDTFTSYIDGVQVGSKTYSGFNSQHGQFKMLLQSSMRQDPPQSGPRSGYPFPAGGNDMIFRYVAAYEPKSANHIGTNGPIIVPGTAVGTSSSTTPPPSIVGDLNGDGHVNVFDLSIFLSHWQQGGSGVPEDLNNDGVVNIFDLSILLSHYGT